MFNKAIKTILISAFMSVHSASAGWFSSETPKTPEVKPIAFDDTHSFDAGSDEISQYDDSASESVIQSIAS